MLQDGRKINFHSRVSSRVGSIPESPLRGCLLLYLALSWEDPAACAFRSPTSESEQRKILKSGNVSECLTWQGGRPPFPLRWESLSHEAVGPSWMEMGLIPEIMMGDVSHSPPHLPGPSKRFPSSRKDKPPFSLNLAFLPHWTYSFHIRYRYSDFVSWISEERCNFLKWYCLRIYSFFSGCVCVCKGERG